MLRAALRHDRRRSRPAVEGLEDRKLLYATLGAGWSNPARITFSFAPDGTNSGGTPSSMFQAMSNRGFTASQWQLAFQKAAAAWAATANINLTLVPDDGSSFGVAGAQQGDSRFGDIRIAGTPLPSGSLAGAFLPPPSNGGTIAGDIIVNTTQLWQINNDYDLQTVAIHEFGHALGMDHSAISTACMYASYTGMKQSLGADDIAGIRAIYGNRAMDAFDAASSNNVYGSSSDLNPYLDASARVTLTNLDIAQTTDPDWFVIKAPANAGGTMTVSMQSTGFSSLSPRLDVFDGSLKVIATLQAPNSFGATLTTSPLANATEGQRFYIKASSASAGSSAVGAYGLQITFGAGGPAQVTASQVTVSQGLGVPIVPPNTVIASQPDQGGGSAGEVISPGATSRSAFGHSMGRGASGVGEMIAIGNLRAVGDLFQFGDRTTNQGRGRFDDGSDAISAPGEPSTALAPPPTSTSEVEDPEGRKKKDRAASILAIDDLLATWGDR